MSELAKTRGFAGPATPGSIVLPRAHAFIERVGERPLEPWIEAAVARLRALGAGPRRRRAMRLARDANRAMAALDRLDDDALDEALVRAAAALRRSPDAPAAVRAATAVIGAAAARTLGVRPYIVQLAAGIAMHRGGAVEMDTGEGKTLATMVGAALHALAGRAVHVVSANDYLAARDGAQLAPAYARLGLSVGVIEPDMQHDARRKVYLSDLVYVSSKELAFDYLRDRLGGVAAGGNRDIRVKTARVLAGTAMKQPVLRGLDVALVDEIDSVLIDDAGTPLLISTQVGSSSVTLAAQALELVSELREEEDFRIDRLGNRISFTDRGLDRIETLSRGHGGAWRQRIRRDELASQALSAIHLFRRDEHYIVRDEKVVIVDANTGRSMADRFWGQGLHQMIELKEGLAGSGDKRPLISSTFQRFFRRYQRLGGTSGTIGEVAHEIASVYRLEPVRIPRRRPSRRTHAGYRVLATADELWREVAVQAAARHARGQPLLIGTRSVEEAETAAARLRQVGLDPVVLSAGQDDGEAAIVARAGAPGAVTVATNIAGRGTDIRLGDGVAELGGLCVFVCQPHASRRVDRQLVGRAARQGDPGEVVAFVSLDDALIASVGGLRGALLRGMIRARMAPGFALRRVQRRHEAHAARQRRRLVASDRRMADLLAFAGVLE